MRMPVTRWVRILPTDVWEGIVMKLVCHSTVTAWESKRIHSLTSFILLRVTDRSTQPCIQLPVQDKRLVRFVQAIRQPAVAEVSPAFRSKYTLGLLLCPVHVLIGISATIYAAGISQSPISTIRVQP